MKPPTYDPFAKRPDVDGFSLRIMTGELTHEDAVLALRQCVDYIERVEMTLDELRDKCLETARVLRE